MVYNEVSIAGDLSQDDVDRANKHLPTGFDPAHSSYIHQPPTWTLFPYGRSRPDYVEFAYGNETVYFSQPSLSQFIPGGSGLGTFDNHQAASLKDSPTNTLGLLTNGNGPNKAVGAVLR